MLLSQHHKRRGNHWAIWNPMGKYRRIKPCDCGWSFTTLQKQRCEPSAWTLLNTYCFTLPILCSHVAPYCIIFSILCFFATASLSSSPTFQLVHVLRVCDQIPTILWPSGRVNHATPPTLSCQNYSSSFNEKSNNSFITGQPNDLILWTVGALYCRQLYQNE